LNWLIAEDEADIRNLVAMMAQVWGHNPITFENGDKIWEWLDAVDAGSYKGSMPDFALMDIRMPGRRGNELAKRIRNTEGIRHIPIVLMTAFVLSDEEIDNMRNEYGIDAVLNKPLPDFDRLKGILDDVITKKQRG
jgi:two-component system phosphate regulon response regulator PhoB